MNKIDETIEKAIKEDWFNKMTTSDLQATCEAVAMGMSDDFREIMRISDKIINGIHRRVMVQCLPSIKNLNAVLR